MLREGASYSPQLRSRWLDFVKDEGPPQKYCNLPVIFNPQGEESFIFQGFSQNYPLDAFCAAERTPVRLLADTRRRQRTAL